MTYDAFVRGRTCNEGAAMAPGQFKRPSPSLDRGPHRDLNERLHQLHDEAGSPRLSQIANAWQKGQQAGKYKAARGTSTIHGMFSGQKLPHAVALLELVEVLMTEFSPKQTDEDVEIVKSVMLNLNRQARRPKDSADEVIDDLRVTGNAYLKLADELEEARLAQEEGKYTDRCQAAFKRALRLAKFLDQPSDTSRNLSLIVTERELDYVFG
ncbi:hypothetical protein ACPCSP_25365 [Streptomyces cinereoruber]|uniref:hypothetical protein n=1 Tax=Streptomyces cinereoruber TaxID=67260 RepID=UPI003C2BB6A3